MISLYLICLYLGVSGANQISGTESELRNVLFQTYDKNNRPVLQYNKTVTVSFGLEVISLEEFDQVSEKVKFNFYKKYTWYDEYLRWNQSVFNYEYLPLDPNFVWKPDLELYNSANSPDKVNGDGILKVYHTGQMYWIVPVIYDFSCSLNLKDFPFDTQKCVMNFGSWKLSKNYLNISTHYLDGNAESALFQPIGYDKFKHNEWEITEMISMNQDVEYLCCPGELWTVTQIDIIMKRSYHKYMVVIIMTFFLTLSALTVTMFLLERYIRTYLLVFIPLSIIWLQLYISSKIPVIEYPTKMEKFIQLSYYTCMFSAIYSGLLYNFAIDYYHYLQKCFVLQKTRELKKDNLDPFTMVIIEQNAGFQNYFNFHKLGLKLYNLDNIFRTLLILFYIHYTIFIFHQ